MAGADIFDDVAQGPTGDIFSDVAGEQKPARKPVTFDSLYRTPQAGPTLSERASDPRSLTLTQSFEPKTFDTTQISRSPFTNQLEPGPRMLTEEEKQRTGVIRPLGTVTSTIPGPHGGFTAQVSPTADEGLARAIGAGAPSGSGIGRLKRAAGLTESEIEQEQQGGMRLFDPSLLMSETEREQHPILTGLGQLGAGLTTPENLAILAGTMGFGELPATARAALSTYFAAQSFSGANDYSRQAWDAYKRGDNSEAQRLWTLAAGNAALAGFAGAHGVKEVGAAPRIGPEPVVPFGTISGPLAMDRATARAANRFADFNANQSARLGMGRLAEAERGTEAARQARINAPVEIPKTYAGPEEPFVLGRPPIRTPMEQLSQEAADVVRQREARQSFQQSLRDEIAGEVVRRLRDEGLLEPRTATGVPVTDRRAVRPEDVPPVERRPEPPIYPLQDEVPPLGREPGQPTQRASIMRIGSEPSAPGAIPERLPPTHGDIFDAVAANRAAPVEATPYQRQQAQLYVNRLRNPIEREHAQSALQARLSGEGEPERTSSLSADRARTIASNLDGYLKAAKPQSITERFSPDVVRENDSGSRASSP